MDCRERGSHARGVYPTQYTWRMATARVNEEQEEDASIIVNGYYEIWKEGRGHNKGEKSQTRPTSAKDLPIMLPEGRESLYHRL